VGKGSHESGLLPKDTSGRREIPANWHSSNKPAQINQVGESPVHAIWPIEAILPRTAVLALIGWSLAEPAHLFDVLHEVAVLAEFGCSLVEGIFNGGINGPR
jgi:hypothetical protein